MKMQSIFPLTTGTFYSSQLILIHPPTNLSFLLLDAYCRHKCIFQLGGSMHGRILDIYFVSVKHTFSYEHIKKANSAIV